MVENVVIIRKKDVERLAKDLVKEIFELLYDEYCLNTFPEIKDLKEKFLRDLVLNKFRYFNVTKIIKPNTIKYEYEKFDESEYNEKLKLVKEEIQNGTLVTEVVFKTLLDFDFKMEINEDLFFKLKSFLDIYKVFKNGYTYLEDL